MVVDGPSLVGVRYLKKDHGVDPHLDVDGHKSLGCSMRSLGHWKSRPEAAVTFSVTFWNRHMG